MAQGPEVGNIHFWLYYRCSKNYVNLLESDWSARENPPGRDKESHTKPENLAVGLVKGISPVVHVAIVKTPHTQSFVKCYTLPPLWSDISSSFFYSSFSSLEDLSQACTLRPKPAEVTFYSQKRINRR